jgi:hypothetical protein
VNGLPYVVLFACLGACGREVSLADAGQDSEVDNDSVAPDAPLRVDAGLDATLPIDGAGEDAQQEPDDSMTDFEACTPPTAIAVTPVLHVNASSSACTPAIVEGIIGGCLDPLLHSCPTSASSDCYSECLTTNTVTTANVETATASWGAFVNSDIIRMDFGSLGFANLGGCVAALDPSASGKRCATAIEAYDECLILACSGCPVPFFPRTDAGRAASATCKSEAKSGACASYAAAIATSCASETADASPGPGAVCFWAVDTVAAAFMARGTTDGGPDASAYQDALRILYGSLCSPGLLDGG